MSTSRMLGLVSLALFVIATSVHAQSWGTIKGKVVWGEKQIPKPKPVNVGANGQCLKDGPIFDNTLVIDKKTKGVKWAMVWFVHPKNYRAPVRPIHPDLVKPAKNTVSFDQPCCTFIPHVMGMRAGQTLVAKNTSPFVHNVNFVGGAVNPSLNRAVNPGMQLVIGKMKASTLTMPVSCNIHKWMNMYVRCFDHPYYAVTDAEGNFTIEHAPAGKWNLVVWHESKGYVVGTKKGVPITVKAGQTTTLKPYELKK